MEQAITVFIYIFSFIILGLFLVGSMAKNLDRNKDIQWKKFAKREMQHILQNTSDLTFRGYDIAPSDLKMRLLELYQLLEYCYQNYYRSNLPLVRIIKIHERTIPTYEFNNLLEIIRFRVRILKDPNFKMPNVDMVNNCKNLENICNRYIQA